VLASYLRQTGIPVLLANIEDSKNRIQAKRYVIHTLPSGLRIGLAGITTDYVQVWESDTNKKGLVFHDAFQTAKELLADLDGQCDVKVLLYHGGFEADLESGAILSQSKENVGYRIAKELSYDLLLTGHQHMDIPFRDLFGTKVMQLPASATKYGVITFEKNTSGLTIEGKSVVPHAPLHPACKVRLQPVEDATQKWLSEPVCTLEESSCPTSKIESATKGSRFADLINHIQLEYSKADISCTSLGNRLEHLEGQISIRQVIAAYPFPNTLKKVEIGEPELKQVLERCAQYFDLKDGIPIVSQSFLTPKVEHYNYDFFLGLDYTIDIHKPIGNRVSDIRFHGEPLQGKKLTLCLNDYRASGTGGYGVYRSCKVIQTFKDDLQELVITYLMAHPTLASWEKSGLKVIW
jgi:2',3'-cyclic-nucleotide 2'-phosphodiesterase/3'-nucleotidase